MLLQNFVRVHYYFFAELPGRGKAPSIDFLPDIFEKGDKSKIRVSYINEMDVKSSLFHLMNADMLVTTGSSFPYIAATLSSIPVVVFGKPKEDGFYPGLLREEFALLEDDGTIVTPSTSELQALTLMKYYELHDKQVPYGVV